MDIHAFLLPAQWVNHQAPSVGSEPCWTQALGDFSPILAFPLLAWAVALVVPRLSWKFYCLLCPLWAQRPFQSLGELLRLSHVRRMFSSYELLLLLKLLLLFSLKNQFWNNVQHLNLKLGTKKKSKQFNFIKQVLTKIDGFMILQRIFERQNLLGNVYF